MGGDGALLLHMTGLLGVLLGGGVGAGVLLRLVHRARAVRETVQTLLLLVLPIGLRGRSRLGSHTTGYRKARVRGGQGANVRGVWRGRGDRRAASLMRG